MKERWSQTQKEDPGAEIPDLTLVLPCFNEAEVLRGTAIGLTESFSRKGIRLHLVLVDNGSTDRTGEIIDDLVQRGLPITKVSVRVNQGYGHGVLEGLAHRRGRYAGFTCADGQVGPEDTVRVYEACAQSSSPLLAKVRRRFRMDGLTRKLVSISYNVLANIVFGGLGSIDLNGNPKILPADYLDLMRLESKDWFLDPEVMIKAKRLGLQVFEFNVIAQMRGGGTSHVKSSTCWEFLLNLLRYRFRFKGSKPS